MSSSESVVFLDRDGVLIHDVHYLSHLKDIKLYEGVPEGLATLKEHGFKLIVVTNQSGIARGYFKPGFVDTVFEHINQQLAKNGVTLDAQFFCPHHPDGNPPYNFSCQCRKPETGMIDAAFKQYRFQKKHCYMIGDKVSDIELAIKADLNGVLLTTGYGEEHQGIVKQRFPQVPVFRSFLSAVSYIIGNRSNLGG